MRRLLTGQDGISLAWTAFLFTFVAIPLMVLVIQGSSLYVAAAEMQKAADAAALAAAQPACIDVEFFRNTGRVRLLPVAYQTARHWVRLNTHYLRDRGVTVRVTRVEVGSDGRTVTVTCRADLTPILGMPITVERTGVARARPFTHW